jgi:hypothetical protein
MRDEYVSEYSLPYKTTSEVAVILDGYASYAISGASHAINVYRQMLELGDMGAPYDLFLKNSLKAEDLKDYKVVIYIAPYAITKSDEEHIKTLKNQGKIVIVTVKNYKGSGVKNYSSCISSATLAQELRSAGVHVYSEGSVVYANERYLCVTARKDGEVLVCFKTDYALQSFISGELYKTENKQLKLSMQNGQSELFKIIE